MNGIMKVLTCILGALAVAACIATVGIIGYSMTGAGDEKNTAASADASADEPTPLVPTQAPDDESTSRGDQEGDESNSEEAKTPQPIGADGHVHDYKETVVKKATCYSAGKLRYSCECGDEYFVDIHSTGHVADDWEVIRKPTAEQDGLQVKKCIYCDEIVAQETIPYKAVSDKDGDEDEEDAPHVHQYTAETVREPSCTLAGLRKYSCSCGSFYTEMIPAPGHVATDWTVAEEPTTTQMGTEQRTCSVCGVLLDSRPINKLSPSPSASAQATAGTQATAAPTGTSATAPPIGSGAQATATQVTAPPIGSGAQVAGTQATAAPTATPHTHNYTSYVLKEANCTEKGIRSFICNCGSSYAESIELNMNNHTFRSVVIPATSNTMGYTVYTCVRCNYSYFDNYTPALGN